jgi:hypothetical protein
MMAHLAGVAKKMLGQARGRVGEALSLHRLPRLKVLRPRRTLGHPVAVVATFHRLAETEDGADAAWHGKTLLAKPSTE